MLQSDFVVGWQNIYREDFVGYSNAYYRGHTAVGTTNGAGPHNIQIFVLSPDLVVLHALPGFWHPDDLARELRFAKVLARLWEDQDRTREQKDDMFRRLQLAEVRRHPAETFARSTWQGFDARIEMQKLKQGPRDTFLLQPDGTPILDQHGRPRMKPINMLTHERMAQRPFVPYEDFDVAAFIDYGNMHYDLNGGGKQFPGQQTLMKRRALIARREARSR
jgi:hypothetical protein